MNPETKAVEVLQKLVRQPSVSGNEKNVVQAAAEEMRALGFDEVTIDATGNVIGLLRGARPGKKILFDAHLDVVKATTPEAWKRDPFSGDLADGCVWGRGSTDNKGSLSAMMVGLSALPREEFAGSIYVVGSVGEETLEGVGHGQTVAAIQPDYIIIGEPTECQLGYGQRGRARVIFRVPGSAGHSSADDQRGNAVYAMARLIARLESQTFPHDPMLGDAIQAPIELMSNPYPSLSTVPVECRLVIDRRVLMGETIESVTADYRKRVEGLPNVTVEMDTVTYTSYTGAKFTLPDFHPAWLTPSESPFMQACLESLPAAGVPAVAVPIPYCTNGSSSAGDLGLPAIVLGPGSIKQAHAMDEFLAVDQLHQAVRVYQHIAKKVLALS
jgi:putative selenium metabolism hydrolase